MSIKTIDRPTVRLVGRQQVDGDTIKAFLADEGVERWETDTEVAGQVLIEVAGRMCYKSFAKPRPGGNKAYTEHILEVGHGSVLEHAVFNFIVTGVSRSFTHELVRHRAGFGYSQLSQRFVDESQCQFVIPRELIEEVDLARRLAKHRLTDRHSWVSRVVQGLVGDNGPVFSMAMAGATWLDAMERSHLAYHDLSNYLDNKLVKIPDKTLRRKRAREAARSVLPNATETQIFVTANARALRHFIEMRGDIAADQEIRGVALAFLEILQDEAPNLFGDYRLDTINGEHATSTPYAKV